MNFKQYFLYLFSRLGEICYSGSTRDAVKQLWVRESRRSQNRTLLMGVSEILSMFSTFLLQLK